MLRNSPSRLTWPPFQRAVRARRGDNARAERCLPVGCDKTALWSVLGFADFPLFLPDRETNRSGYNSPTPTRAPVILGCLRPCYSPGTSPLTPRCAPRCAPRRGAEAVASQSPPQPLTGSAGGAGPLHGRRGERRRFVRGGGAGGAASSPWGGSSRRDEIPTLKVKRT